MERYANAIQGVLRYLWQPWFPMCSRLLLRCNMPMIEKLIHRDVKPKNMLIGSKHEIILSDFGIAVVAHSTRSRKVEDIIGTWTYAAPELFLGTPRSATDQYALAIVAYEWLCGTPPFQGDFPVLYHQHMNVPVPFSRQELMPMMPTSHRASDPDRACQRSASALHQRPERLADALEAASQPKCTIANSPLSNMSPLFP